MAQETTNLSNPNGVKSTEVSKSGSLLISVPSKHKFRDDEEKEFESEINPNQQSKLKRYYFNFRVALWPATYGFFLAAFVFNLSGVSLAAALSLILGGGLIIAAGVHLLSQEGIGSKIGGATLLALGLMFVGIGVSLIVSLPVLSPVLLAIGASMMALVLLSPTALLLMGLAGGGAIAALAAYLVYSNETQPQKENKLDNNSSNQKENGTQPQKESWFTELLEILKAPGKGQKSMPGSIRAKSLDEAVRIVRERGGQILDSKKQDSNNVVREEKDKLSVTVISEQITEKTDEKSKAEEKNGGKSETSTEIGWQDVGSQTTPHSQNINGMHYSRNPQNRATQSSPILTEPSTPTPTKKDEQTKEKETEDTNTI